MLLYLIHEKNGEHESRQQIAVLLIVVEIFDSELKISTCGRHEKESHGITKVRRTNVLGTLNICIKIETHANFCQDISNQIKKVNNQHGDSSTTDNIPFYTAFSRWKGLSAIPLRHLV